MIQTRAELEAELLVRLQISNNSTQYPAARVTQLIQDAHDWAASLFFWPPLARSRIFSSKPNTQSLAYDYYDYPTDMLTNSISRLYIDSKKYDKKAFQDFLDYVDECFENSTPPDQTKRIFAEFARQYFVFPQVSVAGTNDGLLWGSIQAAKLTNASDNTIFSLWDDSGNEAVLKKALSVATERTDNGFSVQQKAEAVQLLTLMWKKIATQLQKSQRLDHPRFNVIDMFGSGSGSTPIGNFSLRN